MKNSEPRTLKRTRLKYSVTINKKREVSTWEFPIVEFLLLYLHGIFCLDLSADPKLKESRRKQETFGERRMKTAFYCRVCFRYLIFQTPLSSSHLYTVIIFFGCSNRSNLSWSFGLIIYLCTIELFHLMSITIKYFCDQGELDYWACHWCSLPQFKIQSGNCKTNRFSRTGMTA